MEQTFFLSLLEKILRCRGPCVSQTEPDPNVALVFNSLEAESKGHHYSQAHGHFRYRLLESSWSLRGSHLNGSVV